MRIHPMWQHFPTLKRELEQTLTLMDHSIQLKNSEVKQAITDMIRSGGKLLRPAYHLLFSQFGNTQDKKKRIALAASLEMLHTATLIHDDIVDKASTRRNNPTIQARFGNDVAVYAGDYLFICCFKLLSEYTSSLKSIQLNSHSMEKILDGELGQMSLRYHYEGGVPMYLKNISGKTAELFALSCFIGAYESGCSKKLANDSRKIGHNIGMAFQILDDILDYTQKEHAIGKPVLEDVKQGVYSLPLLFALEENKKELLPLLQKKENLTQTQEHTLYRIVQHSKAIPKAQQLAYDYTTKALQLIETLPDTSQHTKEQLIAITTMILNRTN